MLRRLTFAIPAVALGLTLAGPARPQDSRQADRPGQPPAAAPDSTAESQPGSAQAKRRNRSQQNSMPATVRADQIVYDRDLNTVTASGHVEVDQGERLLLADNLSYNLKQDVIIATGNVSLTEPDGQVTFADYFELTGDMKRATTRAIRVLQIDDSRIAANRGERVAGDRSIFEKAIYSACKPCAEDPSKSPVWEMKAQRVIHDEVQHIIEYEDAWLAVDGVPVVYTPYFSHADPTIKRRSGLLPPGVLSNEVIGTGVKTPYFLVINDRQDLTLSPMITSSDYYMLAATHRLRTADGEAKTVASITSEPIGGHNGSGTVGWHIDAYSRFDIDNQWRTGYQIQRASDRDYLATFGYRPTQPYLTTRPYLERFTERNYTGIEAYSFQSITTAIGGSTNPSSDPVVLPQATYSFVGEPGKAGDYVTFDTRSAIVSRETGTDSRRVNTISAWHLPYTSPSGQLYNLTASFQADAYNSNDIATDYTKNVSTGRAIPALSIDWRYPFTRLGEHSSQTITPIVFATASPYGTNSFKIPNEDSLDFELDASNIFKPNPGNGYDRVLSGPRVAYGAQYSVVNRGLGAADLLLAQSYRLHNEYVFTQGTGFDDHMSDIVGRANIAPSTNFSMQYDFRLDHRSLMPRRSEVTSSFGPRPFNLQLGYVFYDRLNPSSQYGTREQLTGTLTNQWSHYWSTQLYTTQNLGAHAGPLQTGLRITYNDECFQVVADGGSSHTTLKTFSAGHYLMFRIVLKTIGQIPVDVF